MPTPHAGEWNSRLARQASVARAGLAVHETINTAAMKPRLIHAFLCYAALALLAALTLEHLFRTAVWLFLAALAWKTWIASRRGD